MGVRLLDEALIGRACLRCGRIWYPERTSCLECGAALAEMTRTVHRQHVALELNGLARFRRAGEPRGEVATFAILAVGLTWTEPWASRTHTLAQVAGQIVTTILDRGGLPVQDDGGGLLALFGGGTTAADATLDAVRAAEVLRHLAAGRSRVPGVVGPSMQIGLNVGELAVDGEAVCGAALAFTQALAAAALPAAPLATASVLRLAAGAYDFVGVGARDALGRPLEEPAFALVGPRPAMSHLLVERHEGPMVGRQAEWNRLTRAYRDAATGNGRVVCLVAPPGLGKSRLIATFLNGLGPVGCGGPGLVATGFGAAYGGGPNWTVRSLLGPLLGVTPADDPLAARDQIAARLVDWGIDGEDAEPLVLALTAAGEPALTAAAIVRLLSCLAARNGGPPVLVVDDLHWADASSLAVLPALVRRLRAEPAMVLLSFRPSAGRRVGWALELADDVIRLRPLGVRSRRALIQRRSSGLPPAVEAELAARSRGNPLYLEEAVALLHDRGLLRPMSVDTPGPQSISLDGVPSTLHGVILARIDHLARDRLPAIRRAASVLGNLAWERDRAFADLAAIEAQIGAWLDRLETGAYADRAEIGLYLHRLEQVDAELVLTSMLLGRPRPRHRRLAAAIDRLYAGSWEERLRLLTAAWRRTGNAAGIGYQAYQAAQKADLLGRPAIAARFYALALRAGELDRYSRSHLLRRLAACERASGRAVQAMARYRAIAREVASPNERLDALLALAELASAGGKITAARRSLARARAIAPRPEPVRLLTVAASVAMAAGRLSEAGKLATLAWERSAADGQPWDRASAAETLAAIVAAGDDQSAAAFWRLRTAAERPTLRLDT
ncbi:MAG: AAA family ATPase [Chloroflexi bacterium]|nr:AAA family ATPase [Chloroflexota bacterium]